MLTNSNLDNINFSVGNPDAFFPDLNLTDWQEVFRVSGVAQVTLESQMLRSMADCNLKLATWQAEQVTAGGSALPAVNLNDYTDAVQARATGLLIQIVPALARDKQFRESVGDLEMVDDSLFVRSDSRLARITEASAGRGGIIAVVVE